MKRAVWSVVFFAMLGCSNATPGSGADDAAAQGGASAVSSGGVTATGGAGTAGEQYGFPFSTGTGATPQPLTWTEDWGPTESDPLACPTGSNKFC